MSNVTWFIMKYATLLIHNSCVIWFKIHISRVCVTLLIHNAVAHSYMCIWFFMNSLWISGITWFIMKYATLLTLLRYDSLWIHYEWVVSPDSSWSVPHYSSITATHSYVWHDSVALSYVCDMIHYEFIHMCDMIQWPFHMCAIWFIMNSLWMSHVTWFIMNYAALLIHNSSPFTCVTWIMWFSGSFICVTWFVHTCDMTHSYVWHDSYTCVTRFILMCDMTHSYVQHDSFLCVTWLIHMCDMTHSYAWHDSFIRATWLILMCYMTHSYVRHHSFVWAASFFHMYAMTHPYAWHDSFIQPKNGEIALQTPQISLLPFC